MLNGLSRDATGSSYDTGAKLDFKSSYCSSLR